FRLPDDFWIGSPETAGLPANLSPASGDGLPEFLQAESKPPVEEAEEQASQVSRVANASHHHRVPRHREQHGIEVDDDIKADEPAGLDGNEKYPNQGAGEMDGVEHQHSHDASRRTDRGDVAPEIEDGENAGHSRKN